MKLGPIQRKWLESLKAHPERQCCKVLGRKYSNSSYKACCLGELLICAGLEKWNDEGFMVDQYNDNVLSNSWNKLGLRDQNGHIDWTKVDDKGMSHSFYSLANMNDKGLTWPEIAAFIEKYPEAVLTKGV